jgi:hypothetical protein
MNAHDQLAHFDGAATDVPMTGTWYSHSRVMELVEAARQECRDRDVTEQDVRARLADAEAKLARVRDLTDKLEATATVPTDVVNARTIVDVFRAALDGGR